MGSAMSSIAMMARCPRPSREISLAVALLLLRQHRSCFALLPNHRIGPQRVLRQSSHLRRQFSMLRTGGTDGGLITSTKSNTVKLFQQLLTKKRKRTELKKTVVEGPRMVFDLLRNKRTRSLVDRVLVSSERPEWLEELRSNEQEDNLLLCEGTQQVLEACSDTVTPQGIVATVRIPEPDASSSMKAPPRLALILDGVQDPGNVGTLLRSSVAVGLDAVLLLPNSCDVWNPKAVRSAMGTSFLLPALLEVDCLQDAFAWLNERRGADVIVRAATMEEGASSISKQHFDVDWVSEPSALLIGSEGKGLSEETRRWVREGRIDAVHVPMAPGIESLNAAICGSVILFEFQRQALIQASRENNEDG